MVAVTAYRCELPTEDRLVFEVRGSLIHSTRQERYECGIGGQEAHFVGC